MARKKKHPYASYDVDDWQWEFLRRNRRYKRAYHAIEWLKERFHQRQAANPLFKNFISLFGFSYHITSHGEPRSPGDDTGYNYKGYTNCKEVWTFRSCTALIKGVPREGPSPIRSRWGNKLGLVHPDSSSREYKENLLRKDGVIYEMSPDPPEDSSDFWQPTFKDEISLIVDTRYSTPQILSAVRNIISAKREQTRNRVKLYPSQLIVWDLFQQGFTAEEIAARLYPKE